MEAYEGVKEDATDSIFQMRDADTNACATANGAAECIRPQRREKLGDWIRRYSFAAYRTEQANQSERHGGFPSLPGATRATEMLELDAV